MTEQTKNPQNTPQNTLQTIGILGAMREEIAQLTASLEQKTETVLHGITFYSGILQGKKVIVAQCGISKVNAAMTTVLLLGQGVTQLIFTGVAGGLVSGLKVGDIVISHDLLQHDVDVQALGYPIGLIPDETLSWQADPALRDLALEVAQTIPSTTAIVGRIVTGDQFVADPAKVAWIRATFGGDCCEMEGAAVAQVASKLGVPFVVIRSLSDSADEGAKSTYNEWMPLVARNAKAVVLGMLERM
jgi:adenosylhomocysteine nucleosidase